MRASSLPSAEVMKSFAELRMLMYSIVSCFAFDFLFFLPFGLDFFFEKYLKQKAKKKTDPQTTRLERGPERFAKAPKALRVPRRLYQVLDLGHRRVGAHAGFVRGALYLGHRWLGATALGGWKWLVILGSNSQK